MDVKEALTFADLAIKKNRLPSENIHLIFHSDQAIIALAEEVHRLKGIEPQVPPRPPCGGGLPRYGISWNGPEKPLAVPMDDGYWTPYHLAEQVAKREIHLPAIDESLPSWQFDIHVAAQKGIAEVLEQKGFEVLFDTPAKYMV